MRSRSATRLLLIPTSLVAASGIMAGATDLLPAGPTARTAAVPAVGARPISGTIVSGRPALSEWDRRTKESSRSASHVEPRFARTGATAATGRLIVKLPDHLAPTFGTGLLDGQIVSDAQDALGAFNAVIAGLQLKVIPIFHQSQEVLDEYSNRVMAATGQPYPLLSTYFYVDGAAGQLEAVAGILNGIDSVISVQIEQQVTPSQVDCTACGDPACGLQPFQWVQSPMNPGPRWTNAPIGDQSDDCDESTLFMIAPNDVPCCATVAALLTACGDGLDEGGTWDSGCVAISELLCNSLYPTGNGSDTTLGGGWHPNDGAMLGPQSGCPLDGDGLLFAGYADDTYWSDLGTILPGPFSVHGFPSTSVPQCSAAVCALDYQCCTVQWDDACTALSLSLSTDQFGNPGNPCAVTLARLDWQVVDATELDSPFSLSLEPTAPGTLPTVPTPFPVLNPGFLTGTNFITTLPDSDPAAATPIAGNLNPGNTTAPTTNATPYYGAEIMAAALAGGIPVTDFPLATPLDGVRIIGSNGAASAPVPVPAGSLPVALWGVGDKAAYDANPNKPQIDQYFRIFRSVSGYRGGGLDMKAYNDFARTHSGSSTPSFWADGIKVGLVDLSAFVNHQEFLNSHGESFIEVEATANGTQIPIALQFDENDATVAGACSVAEAEAEGYLVVPAGTPRIAWAHHGTASLGILFANRDAQGVSGLCTNAAEKLFFPATTDGNPDEGISSGQRLSAALLSASMVLTATGSGSTSNVCAVPLSFAGADPDDPTVSFQPINTAGTADIPALEAVILNGGSALGLTWSLAAGNGASAVSEPTAPDCCVVGACWPGMTSGQMLIPTTPPGQGTNPFSSWLNNQEYNRVGESNYEDSETAGGVGERRVWISGWGRSVVTCGYGDLFVGDDAPVEALGYTPTCVERNKLRSYTASYSGTSAATMQIAGMLACFQGHARVVSGEGLAPTDFRLLFGSQSVDGPRVHIQSGSETPDPIMSTPEFGDGSSDQETIGLIYGFPNVDKLIEAITTGSVDDPTNVTDTTVLVGTLLAGNQVSIKTIGGGEMSLRSQAANASSARSGYGGAPVFYPSVSRATDLQVLRIFNFSTQPILNYMRVPIRARISGGFVYVAVFMFNANIRRYDFWGMEQLDQAYPDAPLNFCTPTYRAPNDYIRFSDPAYPGGVAAMRMVTGGYGMVGQYGLVIDLAKVETDLDTSQIPVDPCVGQ